MRVCLVPVIMAVALIGVAGDAPAHDMQPPADTSDILAQFQTYCLDTEMDIEAILSRAGEEGLPEVSEAELGQWSQGIRPHDTAGFLLAEDPFLVLTVSLQGEIGAEHRRKLKAGLAVKSDPVKKDNPLADILDLVPEGAIGTKGCEVFRVGDGRTVTTDQVSALTYQGAPLGGPEFERTTVFAFPAGSVRAYNATIIQNGRVTNFISGLDITGRAFVRLTSRAVVFQSDDPEMYQIPGPRP